VFIMRRRFRRDRNLRRVGRLREVVARQVFRRDRNLRFEAIRACCWNARSILRCIEIRSGEISSPGQYDKVGEIVRHMSETRSDFMFISEHHLADTPERCREAFEGGISEQELGNGFTCLFTRHCGFVLSAKGYEIYQASGSKIVTRADGRIAVMDVLVNREPWRLISVYGPTHQRPEAEKETFWGDLTVCSDIRGSQLLVGGDMNARIGAANEDDG
jgi:hypothetical protein